MEAEQRGVTAWPSSVELRGIMVKIERVVIRCQLDCIVRACVTHLRNGYPRDPIHHPSPLFKLVLFRNQTNEFPSHNLHMYHHPSLFGSSTLDAMEEGL